MSASFFALEITLLTEVLIIIRVPARFPSRFVNFRLCPWNQGQLPRGSFSHQVLVVVGSSSNPQLIRRLVYLRQLFVAPVLLKKKFIAPEMRACYPKSRQFCRGFRKPQGFHRRAGRSWIQEELQTFGNGTAPCYRWRLGSVARKPTIAAELRQSKEAYRKTTVTYSDAEARELA